MRRDLDVLDSRVTADQILAGPDEFGVKPQLLEHMIVCVIRVEINHNLIAGSYRFSDPGDGARIRRRSLDQIDPFRKLSKRAQPIAKVIRNVDINT